MDLSTTIGIILGALLLYGSTVMPPMPSYLGGLVNIPSIIIVLGGCICIVIASYPFGKIFKIIKYSIRVFANYSMDTEDIISEVVEIANRAREGGLLKLERSVKEIENDFFRKGMLMVIDGTDPELVQGIMETQLYYIDERHKEGAGIFELCANAAPSFGMIGSLLGIMEMLKNLSAPERLGPDMAGAILSMLYGVILANMVFNPIVAKLRQMNDKELLEKTIVLEGILSIQAGENPRVIEEKLLAFLHEGIKEERQEDED